MSKVGNQEGLRIPLPEGFTTKAFATGARRVTISPENIHLSWSWDEVFVNYGGAKAVKAGIIMTLPKDPDVLRAISKGLMTLANELDD